MGHTREYHSGLVIIVAPQEGLGSPPSCSLDELRVIEGLYFLLGAAHHREDGEADRGHSEGRRPLYFPKGVPS